MQWYTLTYILFFAICLTILLIEYRFVNDKIISSHPTTINNRTSIIKEEAQNNIITSSSSTNDISNFWDNVDLNNNTTKLNCGRYKCLFRAKMNEDVGYLIFSNHHTPGTGIQFETEAETSYQVAEHMKSNFDIKHLYIDKPIQVKMISLPNSYNQTLKGRRRHKSKKKNNIPMFYANQYAIVQKIQIAKDPWIIISLPEGYRKLKYFYREKVSIRRSTFTNTLRKDTIAAMKALQHIPLLSNDYQIILDGNGNLYQFDIDRVFLGGIYKSHHHFNGTFMKNYDQCMKMLREILTWSSSSSHHHGRSDGNTSTYIDERKQYKSGEEILSEYHLKNSSSALSSCHASEVVRNMSGRIEDTEVTTKTAMQMMEDLAQMILPNEPQHEIDNNCSRLPI